MQVRSGNCCLALSRVSVMLKIRGVSGGRTNAGGRHRYTYGS